MRRGLGLVVVLVATGVVLSVDHTDHFDHSEHAALFPTCTGCHAGIGSGDAAAFYTITPEGCAECHDGDELDAVDWTGPTPTPDNLVFDHGVHAERILADDSGRLDCETCHRADEELDRMEVEHAVAETCIGCHAHAADEHLAAGSDCAVCHLPLTAVADVPASWIAQLPEPADHEREGFDREHGEAIDATAATCAVCHARESCERCHLNADRLPSVVALGRDDRVAQLLADVRGEWPEPESHDRSAWAWTHGEEALREIEGCANCHARESCEACHLTGVVDVIAELPRRSKNGPTGVVIGRTEIVGHGIGFAAEHGTAAALDTPRCAACHTERQCADCHEGPAAPEFHAVDFVLRHGAEAFANDTECAACHSREGFCRDCHEGVGTVAGARSDGGYHDADPSWILSHGAAARQDLEACVVCHQQTSCLQCHSAKSGVRVSPHGPDFDPSRAAERSTQVCAICHLEIPDR